MKIHTYNTEKYTFRELIQQMIGTDRLEDLTAVAASDTLKNSLYKNMESAEPYRKLYQELKNDLGLRFYSVYDAFIKEVIRPQFDGPIYYQATPTHRILFKDVQGEPRFHRDTDYGHHPAEINFQVPQTRVYGTNAMWIESEQGKKDYRPAEMELGQYLQFDGANLEHGAKANETGQTRVTFDFRVIRQADIEKADHRTFLDAIPTGTRKKSAQTFAPLD